MKKYLSFLFLFLLAGCATPGDTPPDNADEFPPDYIVSLNQDEVTSTEEGSSSDEAGVDAQSADTQDDLFSCREQNAENSLEIDALKKKMAACQKELTEKLDTETTTPTVTGMKPSHLQLIRDAILNSEQKEYPFKTCGQMGTFIRNSWYDSFTRQLAQAKIRFSNGFIEAEDLFGGCQSTEGKMVFFLGAERGEDITFFLVKFDTANKVLEPALMLDDASSAVVTEFGKREGPYVKFPSDDGRLFRYYYDANVVVEAP